MIPAEVDALVAIRKVYGAPVLYTGADLNGTSVTAIRQANRARPHEGMGGQTSQMSFEIDKAALPGDPGKGDVLVELSGAAWRVIDRDDAEDIDSWVLWVEEVSAP